MHIGLMLRMLLLQCSVAEQRLRHLTSERSCCIRRRGRGVGLRWVFSANVNVRAYQVPVELELRKRVVAGQLRCSVFNNVNQCHVLLLVVLQTGS